MATEVTGSHTWLTYEVCHLLKLVSGETLGSCVAQSVCVAWETPLGEGGSVFPLQGQVSAPPRPAP